MSATGVVKKFFEDKGFGFVTPDDGSEDVFVHVKDNPDLDGCGPGDAVYFDSEWDDRSRVQNEQHDDKVPSTLPCDGRFDDAMRPRALDDLVIGGGRAHADELVGWLRRCTRAIEAEAD